MPISYRCFVHTAPGPGQIDAKVEIMNEKWTTVGTIMSSESYNYIIHVLLSATLFFAYIQAQTNLLQM